MVVPSPSSPASFVPQQYAAPLVVTPHGRTVPALTAAKVRPPPTATGVKRPCPAPSPSWPWALSPQQYAAPVVVSPHVWRLPALTAAKVSAPATATGVMLQGVPL